MRASFLIDFSSLLMFDTPKWEGYTPLAFYATDNLARFRHELHCFFATEGTENKVPRNIVTNLVRYPLPFLRWVENHQCHRLAFCKSVVDDWKVSNRLAFSLLGFPDDCEPFRIILHFLFCYQAIANAKPVGFLVGEASDPFPI